MCPERALAVAARPEWCLQKTRKALILVVLVGKQVHEIVMVPMLQFFW